MPFGLFFDFMDGKVARWRKKSSLMGQELDSLADLVRQTDRRPRKLAENPRFPLVSPLQLQLLQLGCVALSTIYSLRSSSSAD